MKNGLRETIERFRIKAEAFLKEDVRVFIIDVNDNYYFCDILFVGEDYIYIENFKGVRVGQKERLYWADIVKFEGYKEVKKDDDKRGD